MKQCSKCFTNKVIVNFSSNGSGGLRGDCKECCNQFNKEYYKINKLKIIKQNCIWQKTHPETVNNKNRRWAKDNPEKMSIKRVTERTRKKCAVPEWLNDFQLKWIKQIYLTARKLSKELKISFHVDHIIPLKGKDVSGLHVPWNLQVLSAKENLIKGNR